VAVLTIMNIGAEDFAEPYLLRHHELSERRFYFSVCICFAQPKW